MSERGQTGAARRLATILATDVCGYTALSERDPLGAPAAIDRLTERVRAAAARHGGRVFSRAGDGFLCEFPTATAGVAAALDMAEEQRAAPIEAAGEPIRLRTGLHTGEVTAEASGDLLGHAVNVASRLQGAARPGGILMSDATRGMSAAGAPTRRVGDLKLKNLREPVRAYEVLERGGLSALVARLDLRGRAARNRGALTVLGGAAALVALVFGLWTADRYADQEAALAAAARQAEIEAEAARLADSLVAEESRLLDRGAVERAAAGLLGSEDARKAEAIRLLLDEEPLAAARSLRAVHTAQAAAGEPDAARLRTAMEVGALAAGRDQSLAQWAYEEAYAATPDEPYVLRRLADIAVDRGRHDDARVYIDALLAVAPNPGYQVYAHNQLGHIARGDGDYAEAERRHRLALAIARSNDLAREQGWALRNLGLLASEQAQRALMRGEPADALFAAATDRLTRALRLARAVDDAALTGVVYNGLAVVAQNTGDLDGARAYFGDRLTLAESAGNQADVASVAFNLAGVSAQLGDKEDRDRYLARARDAAEKGRVEGMLGYIALNEAMFAASDGDPDRACAILTANEAVIDPTDRGAAQVRQAMGPLPCDAEFFAERKPE